MKFYHGTSYEAWEKIQEEGILFGKNDDDQIRCTHLAFNTIFAENFGDVILEVEYDPTVNPYKNTYSYNDGYMIRVEEPIPLENITFYYDVNKKRAEEKAREEEERLAMEKHMEEERLEIERRMEEERLAMEKHFKEMYENNSSTN